MIEENSQTGLEIAVIGMSGRFPGAKNIDEFWNNLRNGVESISFFSTQELAETQVSPGLLNNPGYVKARGILEDIEYFDAVFFGYTPREAELMDPQMRLFHEIAWEALEDGGYDPYSYEGLIGFYAGAAQNHYWEGLAAFSGKSTEVGKWTSSQLVDKDYMTMRISYAFNLIGPSFSMYTACSTSLVAIHLACQAILNGECDLALAGGITLMLPQKTGYLYQEGMIMSPEGHCRAFDADSKGTITGNGAGVMLLKRLEDAVADRDHIYALVKGSAINNDGIRKSGFTAPSVEGQVEVIREALNLAHVEPGSISFVETHGTGTELGDPIEIKALTLAFDTPGRNFCALGAVKTNIGHLDAAAGAAGFIKTVLALTHRLIPPSLHFENPNPKIDFENTPFYVNTVPREWKNHQYPLRAGVSSFGIGGTNAHVVLEEWPDRHSSNAWSIEHGAWSQGRGGVSPPKKSREYQLILLSAKTETALEKMTQNLAFHLEKNPGINLADTAYTLQVGRKALEYRRMLVCANIEEAAAGLTALESGGLQTTRAAGQDERNVVFMFPGQGAQYVNMGLDLYKTERVFREEMNRCFEILNGLLDYNIKDILYPDIAPQSTQSTQREEIYDKTSATSATSAVKINQTEIAQPVLFIFEYALAKLLMHWGIKPYALIGHSIGEYTAACLSGVFSLEDALTVVVSRGKLMQQMPTGAMLSIFVPEEELKPLLNKNSNVSLAAVNGPRICVISGTHEAINQFDLQAKAKGYETRRLYTSHAFHSAMMEAILKRFAEVVGLVSLNKPKIPYISNLTGHWQAVEQAADPDYWTAHLRQPVRFADGISLLAKIKHPIFVEVGPGQALSTFVRQYKQKEQETAPPVTNLVRHPQEEKSDTCFLLDRIGGLWLYGCKIDWKGFYRDEKRRRTPLPTYPFQGQPYWIDEKSLTFLPGKKPGESLSEKKPDIGDWFYIPSWKRSILPTHSTGKKPDQSLSGKMSHWLLFMDTCGLGEQLARRLAKDNTVTRVKPGPGFAHTHAKEGRQEEEYTINPAVSGDYDALLNELCSNSQFPQRIVHLWNVTAPGAGSLNNDDSEITAFFSLLHLVQAIGKQNQDNSIHLAVVTSSMQEVTGEEILNPQKAMILGPLMVTPYEYPDIRCCAIDIVTPEPGSMKEKKLTDQLAAELTSHFPDKIIAFRGNYRLVQAFEPVHPGPVEDKVPCLRDKGVYLITGGWGGIGLELAGYLAQTCCARLVLVGRSVFPGRGEWDHWLSTHPEPDRLSRKILKIKALEQAGAEVLLLSADVANYQQMQQVIDRAETCFGSINGVIHAAGVPGGGMIQLKKTDTANQVLAPKVKGTLLLDRLFNTKPLDFFLLCSSINSVLPRLGQVDYYAANAFMDAFAHYKTSGSGTFTVSINWDTWQQVGMAKEAVFRGLGAREADHPLLEYHINDGPGVDAYLTRLSFNGHWVLNEHMIPDKKGLLPGTAYLEMVRAAFSFQAEEVETGIEVRDVQFLTPLVVPEGEETDAALILKKQEKGFDFMVVSRLPGEGNGQSSQRTHAVGNVSALDSQQGQAPKIHDIERIKALCNQDERIREQKAYLKSQPSPLLVFGPRWSTIKRVNYGKNQALAYLELDEAYTGDLQWYKLHPSLLDAAAAFLCKYINNTSAYIPYAYKRLTLVKDLPPRIFSYSRWLENNNPGKEFLTFNITLMDEKGVELAEIEEFTMMEVSRAVKERVLGAISRTPDPAAGAPGGNDSGDIETGIFDRWDQQLEFLQKGLQPAEGIEVLKRILAFPAVMPQVVVSTVDLAARLKAAAPGTRGPTDQRLTKPNKIPRPTNPRPELRSVYVAPKKEMERRIVGLWQDILGIDKIGIHDDFFELGGNSLNIVQLNGLLKKELDRDIPVTVMFRYLNIHSFIHEYLNRDKASKGAPDQKRERSEVIKKGKDRLKTRISRSSRISGR
jgi:acyl transferase domain-containing protein/acyl carrier protein